MTAKEYLSRAYRLNAQIESNLRQIQALYDMATSITSDFSERVQGGKKSDVSKTIEKIVLLRQKTSAETDELMSRLAQIKRVISAVPGADERLVLTLRYVEMRKWEDISQRLNFSLTSVHRIHNKALFAVQEIISDNVDNT